MSTDKPSTATDTPKTPTDKQRFIEKLREETNYPTLRNLYLTFYLISSSLYAFAGFFGSITLDCSASGCPFIDMVNCLFQPKGLR